MGAKNHSALPAWSQRLISELELADARAERLARGLSREQLNWSPTPGAWGIGQCLEHLRIGNEIYLTAISKSLEGRQQSPVQEVKLSALIRWFIRNYIGPEMGTRAKAPERARPAAALGSSVLDAFLGTNKMARELICKASAYDVNRVRFKNPFVSFLRFTVGTGIEIVSQHEKRHLLQAERVRQSPGFPGRDAMS
jgi:hypothetical protein